ncbi:MAG: CBS domain-containing protein [Pseudonocardia sp.]|nr:CBS domain-containing protein [Pseudonocardia sp.]MBO0871785.1 CBS domain-containing protein [Pseudonocardia sp.]
MKVESILRSKPHQLETVQPWSSVESAIARLTGPPSIGALVVTGVEHGFTGMLSERDIIRSLARYGPETLHKQVRDVMSRHVPTCSPTDDLAHAMVEVTRTRYRHLPVLDRGELVGIVSIGDLVRARLEEMSLEAGVLRDLYLMGRR